MMVTFINRQPTKSQYKNIHNQYNNTKISHLHNFTKHKSMTKTLIIFDFMLYSILIIVKYYFLSNFLQIHQF